MIYLITSLLLVGLGSGFVVSGWFADRLVAHTLLYKSTVY